MSKLLEEIIADLRARRLDYEAYLQRVADLARRVQIGHADDSPKALKGRSWLQALYDNLAVVGSPAAANVVQEPVNVYGAAADPKLELALAIDAAVRRVRPDDWRGHQARENEVKRALLPLLHNDAQEVERLFIIIKAQREY
jgi:type I restriction enzyme R subunit